MVDNRCKSAQTKLGLRAATAADSEFVFRVWKATMQRYVEATWGWDESSQRQRQQEEFCASTCRIIEAHGRPVGTLIVNRRENCVYLSGLYVLPEHQGQGLGSQVLQGLFTDAKRNQLPIRLRVLKVNSGARRLYERNGFVATDETDVYFVVMEKKP
ncbi:MAG: GNAT family N-acetyltransferase [Chloroflexi bacterium]|nr:GNAT family N-acetyltransferase [Chloroflexota bacterium]